MAEILCPLTCSTKFHTIVTSEHQLAKNKDFIIRLASNAPVIGTVAVGGRRINLIVNKPPEPSVSTQPEAITSPGTGVPTVGVQVAHDKDVVRVPESLHIGVDVYQRFHLFHGRVWVCMEAYQHQLRRTCNSIHYAISRRFCRLKAIPSFLYFCNDLGVRKSIFRK